MKQGGRRPGAGLSRATTRFGLLGLTGLVLMVVIPLVTTDSASAVSSHVPTVTASGSFVYGRHAVPTATRRVVNTSLTTVRPLSLLFFVASGDVPTPSVADDPPAAAVAPLAPVVVPRRAVATQAAPPWNGVLPPLGKAWAWGCPAAIQYLTAYAAPGFSITCPGNAAGHEATTICVSTSSPCNMERAIIINEACPAAYMNEASNSWVLLGVWDVPIDPFGQCD